MERNSQALILYQEPTPLKHVADDASDHYALNRTMRWPARCGLALIFIFVIGFGGWATFVPLAGGAIAPGVLSPDGSKRTVQHLEGGIIRKLHIRDGTVVRAGQPLLTLESIQPKARHNVLEKQQRDLKITLVRLSSESKQAPVLEFPDSLMRTGDPEAIALMESQRRLFEARLATHTSKQGIIRQRIRQLRQQIRGLDAQTTSVQKQMAIIREEIESKQILMNKGLLTKPVFLRLKRIEAELEGRLGQYAASIAQAHQQVGEAKLQILANDAELRHEIATRVEKIRGELNAIDEKLLASKDVLARTIVRAPVSGKVVNLHFKTESGVIQPGTPILEIVPTDEKLIIDARISPMDIDIVKVGLPAQIQLSAFSARSTPRLNGIVRSVSADRIVEKSSNQPYYLARVEVAHDALATLGPKIKLVPGMSADVLIVTGQRTMANYLFDPIIKAVWKTFREA